MKMPPFAQLNNSEWFYEQQDEVKCLPLSPHSPDLNIAELLWEVLGHREQNSFLLPSGLNELEAFLLEERSSIPAHTVQDKHV